MHDIINITKLKAYIGLFLVTIIIGLSFIFVKIGLQYSNTVDLLAHRFSVALFSIIFLQILGLIKTQKLTKNKIKMLSLLSVFYPLLFFFFQTYGMKYSSSSEAGIIFATIPLFTLISARFFLKEKTSLLQKIGVFLSIIGICFIIFKKTNFGVNFSNVQGIIFLFFSILSFVGYIIIGKKLGSKFNALEITILMTFIAFIIFNAWSISSHLVNNTMNKYFDPFLNLNFVWAIIYLGVLSSVVSSFLTNYALSLIPASQIAIINNLSPIIAIIGGIIFLDEKFYSYHLVGGSLVLGGILFTIIFKKKS